MWSIVKDWIDSQRLKEAGPSTEAALLQNQDQFWFEARNYAIKGVTFSIQCSQMISLAIKGMQGLTNSLKVKSAALIIATFLFLSIFACAIPSFIHNMCRKCRKAST